MIRLLSRIRRPAPAETAALPGACANCGDTTPGRYCPSCGQARRQTLVSLREMLVDFLDDQLSLSSRLPRTVGLLLVRPGFLTEEYLRGRIASYIRPLRLYLGASVVFFLLLSVLEGDWVKVGEGEKQTPAPAATIPADAPVGPAVRERVAAAQETAEQLRKALPGGAAEKSWVDEIELETGSPALQRLVEERKDHFRGMTPGEALREVASAFQENVPTVIFLLLPLYALLLKLLYVRRRRLYVEHFVFALHLHAFVFALFTLMLLLQRTGFAELLFLWVPVYVFLAMRRVYRQPLLKTGVKYLVLGWGYSALLTLAMVSTAVVTLLLV